MRHHRLLTVWLTCLTGLISIQAQRVFKLADYGVRPNQKTDVSQKVYRALADIRQKTSPGDSIILRFEAGEYHFHARKAAAKTYFISNHDQVKTHRVGLVIENMAHVCIDGGGARFIFHGRMLPVALVNSHRCSLNNFSIDFENPWIAQIKVLKNEGADGITFRISPQVKYRINAGELETYGEGWTQRLLTGVAFDPQSRHLIYHTSDISFSSKDIRAISRNVFHAPHFIHEALIPGTIVALRSWERPSPGIFLSGNTHTEIHHVKVHYAQGMGLLAQRCDGIVLDNFGVCLKGDDDPRYFTTQADATHFSQCRGRIDSHRGIYEGMMDDAINVHGIYLKVMQQTDRRTVIARYMHHQAWGFNWGQVGDSIQLIAAKTMDVIGRNTIERIEPTDAVDGIGMKEFRIVFRDSLPSYNLNASEIGLENLTWTPEVHFYDNLIRNNRARGALFSSPRKTIVEHNLFDHTAGSGILLCGDCNGWYESGACRDITIRDNIFINNLTSLYQFTNAIISIFPVIPDLAHQQSYYHGGRSRAIRIEHNVFRTFDSPILYAQSVDGLLFKDNIIEPNKDFPPLLPDKSRFVLEHVTRAEIE